MAFLIFKEFSPLPSSGFPPRPPIPFVTSCIATLFSLLSSHPSSFSGSFLQARSPTSSLRQVAVPLQDDASGSSTSMQELVQGPDFPVLSQRPLVPREPDLFF